MAGKRGKSQARRNTGGSGGVPGWAWGVIGLVLGIVLILVAPKVLRSDGDGFLRPRPNPDAQPAQVESEQDELGVEDTPDAPARETAAPAKDEPKKTNFDFYEMLPGKEVPLSDAELAATARAEAEREAARKPAAGDAAAPADASTAATAPPAGPGLPAPVATEATEPAAATTTTAGPVAPAPAAAPDTTRYLLQAGAFEASGQAEELKAKIAMLGVGARVESAKIGGRTVFRVRMGPYGSAGELAEAKRKLASGGLPAMAIKVE